MSIFPFGSINSENCEILCIEIIYTRICSRIIKFSVLVYKWQKLKDGKKRMVRSKMYR